MQNWKKLVKSGMILTLSLWILTSPLTACSTVQREIGSPKLVVPILSPPPSKAAHAIVEVGKTDPSTAAWVIQLDRYYKKVDTIR